MHYLKVSVRFYVRNGLNCSNTNFFDENHERFLLNLRTDGKQLNLLCTYRNCRSKIETYIDFLNSIKGSVDLVIGDLNQDLLKINSDTIHYINFMKASGFASQIDYPTRVTDTSSTCLDHCFSKNHVGRIETTALDIGISDHYCLSICLSDYELKEVQRSYTFCDLRLVKAALSNIDWSNLLRNSDVDKIYEEITEKIDKAKSEATETILIDGRNRKRKEWINQTLIDKCRRKNYLYKLRSKYPFCSYIKNELKMLQDELKKDIKRAKSNYYEKKFNDAKTTKDYWKITNSIIKGNSGHKGTASPEQISDENGDLIDVSLNGEKNC